MKRQIQTSRLTRPPYSGYRINRMIQVVRVFFLGTIILGGLLMAQGNNTRLQAQENSTTEIFLPMIANNVESVPREDTDPIPTPTTGVSPTVVPTDASQPVPTATDGPASTATTSPTATATNSLPPTAIATGGPPPTATPTATPVLLTRIFRGDDGHALYLTERDGTVTGFGEHPGLGYAYVLQGTLSGNQIDANFWDIPKGTRKTNGTITLQVSQGGARLVRKSSSQPIGADTWEEIAPESVPWPGPKDAGYPGLSAGNFTGRFRSDTNDRHYVREVGGTIVAVAESGAAINGRPVKVTVYIGKRTTQSIPVAGYNNLQIHALGTYASVPKGITQEDGSYAYRMATNRNTMLIRDNAYVGQLSPDYVIDWDAFAEYIDNQLAGTVVGYGYAIGQGTTLKRANAGGHRQLAVDGSQLPFTTQSQAQAFSTSKTITAIAMAKALHERGLSVDDTIESHLPPCWTLGSNVEYVTFRNLMDHTSGFSRGIFGTTPYENLKNMVANGSTGTYKDGKFGGAYQYNNVAYSLMRYLVPMVDDPTTRIPFSMPLCGAASDLLNKNISLKFEEYLVDELFTPIGATVAFNPTGDVANLYSLYNPGLPGIPPNPNGYLNSGAGYVAISPLSFQKLLGAFDQGLIVPKQLVQEMYMGRMGFDPPTVGALGDYHFKNGRPPYVGCNYDGRSQLLVYPEGVHAWLTINSHSTDEVIEWYFDETGAAEYSGALKWGKTRDAPAVGDFDHDGKVDDIVAFRSSTAHWYIDYDADGNADKEVVGWGTCEDKPVVGDFDRDGYSDDIGVFRPETGQWFFDTNLDGVNDVVIDGWGSISDQPVAGDFDKDGYVDDIGLFRGSNQHWYFSYNLSGDTDAELANWGQNGDRAIVGDFDGDGIRNDIGVFRSSNKTIYFDYDMTGSVDATLADVGQSKDIPIVGDFDGDGRVNETGMVRQTSINLATILREAFDRALR